MCNRCLGISLLLMLISGIQMEATSGAYAWAVVVVHIVLGLIMTALAVMHIYLHYKRGNWFARFAQNPNMGTRVLWWVFLITAATGIAATVMWIVEPSHSLLGAVHGKIGFLMVLAGVLHHRRHKKPRRAAVKPQAR